MTTCMPMRGPADRQPRHDDMKDLRCMSFTSKGTAEIIVAGLQDKMLVIDLNKGEVVKQVRLIPTARREFSTPY